MVVHTTHISNAVLMQMQWCMLNGHSGGLDIQWVLKCIYIGHSVTVLVALVTGWRSQKVSDRGRDLRRPDVTKQKTRIVRIETVHAC